jgi:hypothetical protein
MPSSQEKTKSSNFKSYAGPQLSRHAMQEFGPGKAGFIFCPHGEAVYYKKSWHHTEKFFLNPPKLTGKGIKFKLCPAHEMLKNKQYEGEVIIKNVPAKFRQELLNLIKNMGERAMRQDILERVLELKTKNSELKVTTSENQLAQKIGRKVKEVFRGRAKTKILRSKEGDTMKLVVDFDRFPH